ncbi:DUF2644 domain-containing protein [Rodentibacter myodis]|uniref:DUF2644 domain-containing protein n=1 Tax=Rodentibacter myodis TaxID=1907939 RepID=A0A1V3JR68_9PAST|nr:DUF2644 domain-containing protein [Rodentibacter myodis]OOF59307.1 hypothetical protein BKL49_04330 [Rodentibacter myodis]
MSNKFTELFTNNDGRASTTGFIQFFGFLVMAGVLVYSVYLDRAITTDLYFYFACFCGGSAATKGAVAAYQAREKSKAETQEQAEVDFETKPKGI